MNVLRVLAIMTRSCASAIEEGESPGQVATVLQEVAHELRGYEQRHPTHRPENPDEQQSGSGI
jgi:hypothetical protein